MPPKRRKVVKAKPSTKESEEVESAPVESAKRSPRTVSRRTSSPTTPPKSPAAAPSPAHSPTRRRGGLPVPEAPPAPPSGRRPARLPRPRLSDVETAPPKADAPPLSPRQKAPTPAVDARRSPRLAAQSPRESPSSPSLRRKASPLRRIARTGVAEKPLTERAVEALDYALTAVQNSGMEGGSALAAQRESLVQSLHAVLAVPTSEVRRSTRAMLREAARLKTESQEWAIRREDVAGRIADVVANYLAEPGSDGTAKALPTSETYPSYLNERETEYLLRHASFAVAGRNPGALALSVRLSSLLDLLRDLQRFGRHVERVHASTLASSQQAFEASLPNVSDAKSLVRDLLK